MSFYGKSIHREEVLDKVKHMILASLDHQAVIVYLFGSWARKEERRTSDIDVAIWYDKPLLPGTLTHIRFMLEESLIPYRVDVVDLTKAERDLVEKVQEEGIIWKDYRSE